MKNKFIYLTKESIKNKLNTKWFKIMNLILLILIPCLVNIDSIIKFFGGEFNEPTKIHIVDDIVVYDELKSTIDINNLGNYKLEIIDSKSTLNDLKEELIKEEKEDIIVHIYESDNTFDVEIMSYEYIDTILYQTIVSSLNTVKSNKALLNSNIDIEILNNVYKEVEVSRVYLNPDLKENEELMELIGTILMIIFILPCFFLIITIVQMIGAEINEEKSSKSMEIIISSVSPKIHFLSKLISANVFAIVQGVLFIVYSIIGSVIRVVFFTPDVSNLTSQIPVSELTGLNEYVKMFIESDMASRIVSGLPLIILMLILSFLAYSLLSGILASMTTNMEDFQQLQSPIMLFLMTGYMLAISSVMFDGSILMKVASYIPFVSGILSPVTYTLGQISLIELAISNLLLLITCYLLFKYGLRIYKVGILNYSSDKLWTKILKSLKQEK